MVTVPHHFHRQFNRVAHITYTGNRASPGLVAAEVGAEVGAGAITALGVVALAAGAGAATIAAVKTPAVAASAEGLSAAASTPAAPVLPMPPVATQPIVVARYELPTADLNSLASSAGLQWVQSDGDRVAAVQAAMAAQPQPVHVPREPRPRMVEDVGLLVLVETKKDLSQMKLPFESSPH